MPVSGRKKRKKRQSKRKLYQLIREDLQLSGDLPTTPEGALRTEVVPISIQTEQPLPAMIQEAIRKGWKVDDEKKPKLVDELIGIIEDPEQPTKVKVTAFNALRAADKDQYERDNPEAAGKAKGSTKVDVVNNNTVQVGNVFDDIERDMQLILEQRPNTKSDNVQTDSATEPLDAPQADNTEKKSTTD